MTRFYLNRKRGPAAPKPSDEDLKTRHVGTCPVCQNRQKLGVGPKGLDGYVEMVHHGYQRPGHGSIVGDCFGVHLEPYERSATGCEKYSAHCKLVEEARTEALKKLESGEIRTLSVQRRKPGHFGRSPEDFERVTLSVDSESAKERADFARELQSHIDALKNEIRGYQHEQKRMAGLIAAWERKPVITWQEHLETVKREKWEAGRERREELARKKAARDEKARILAEKKARWEQEKAALMAKYKNLFTKLHTGLESVNDRKMCALSHWRDMLKAQGKKTYLNFYPSDLGIDEALIALDLAKTVKHTDGRPWTYYADLYGHLR